MRLVTAVDCPELHQYVNVVIFPARDNYLNRSIPAECSGGVYTYEHEYIYVLLCMYLYICMSE
jgi:hypothetical protein